MERKYWEYVILAGFVCTLISLLIMGIYASNRYNVGYDSGYEQAKSLFAPEVLPNAPMYLIEPGKWISLHGYKITYLGRETELAYGPRDQMRIHVGILMDNDIETLTYQNVIGEVIKVADLRLRIVNADSNSLTFEDVTPP